MTPELVVFATVFHVALAVAKDWGFGNKAADVALFVATWAALR